MCYILLVCFFLNVTNILAQDEYDIDSIDNKAQKFFDNKDWRGLIIYGERAIRNRLESYKLRYRLGIAYFAERNYFKAIPNLEKANSISPDAETAEYLYYSYLLTGRDEDKNYIFYDLPKGIRKILKPFENSFVDNVSAEYSKWFSNDNNKNKGIDLQLMGSLYGEQILNGDYNIFKFGLSQSPIRFLNVSYDYTYRRISKQKQQQFISGKITDNYLQYHNQFYNRFEIRIANGLSVSPAGHYISIRDSTFYPDYNNLVPVTLKKEDLRKNFILSLSVSKYFSIFNFVISGSISYLNKVHQSQYGIAFKSYFFSKISFYTLNKLVLHNQEGLSNLIATQAIGGRFRKLMYEAHVSIGNMYNFNEQDGYLVYDDPDIIKYKFGAYLSYDFTNNLRAQISYNFQYRERLYLTYGVTKEHSGSRFKKVNYNINSLLMGLNFIF
ncbi:MAG: hypothetical protein M3P82_05255 [Bacteroidota bacterium]|nr:hypothetical protein [Bacteroidota bacterium]